MVNARDISQKSFSPIQSEIFASQKQSRLEFKDRQRNYNNCIKSLFPQEEATMQESTAEGKDRRQRRRNSKAKRAQLKLEKQPLFLMVFISYS